MIKSMAAKKVALTTISLAALAASAFGGYSLKSYQNQQATMSDSAMVDSGGQGDVVALVDGSPLTMGDLRLLAPDIPEQLFDEQLPFLVEQLVDLQILVSAAEKASLDHKGEVVNRIKASRDTILAEAYVLDELEKRITDEKMEAAYKDYLSNNPPQREISARHILLKTEEDALQVIASLDEGADFATLAQEKSTGPSSSSGGDLGFFTADRMVKAFSDVAFDLKTGEYSEKPVQTQFGWHVIKVEDERQTQQPSFEEIEDQLKQSLSRVAYQDLIEDLKSKTTIEILLENDTPEAEPVAEETGLESKKDETPENATRAME